MTTDILPGVLKTPFLFAKTSGAKYRFICMLIDGLAFAQQAKMNVVRSGKISTWSASAQSCFTPNSMTTDKGKAPMETGAFYRRAGKGKGRGNHHS